MQRLILALVLGSLTCSTCQAESITFDVVLAQDTVLVGSNVDWQVFLTVGDSDENNFGIASVAVSLTDSAGDAMNAGTIGGAFANYGFNYGGTVSGSSLIEIASILTVQDNAKVVAAYGGNLGPILLASGSYQANTLGVHNLSSFAGSINIYFTAVGQLNGAIDGTVAYSPAIFNSASFTVNEASAVPEPSSAGLAALCIFFYASLNARHRRRPLSVA